MNPLFYRITISSILRWAFAFGAILTLFVSAVSLYSWHVQSQQIRYALDDYFPKIQASFQLEENLNALIQELNEFQHAPNTTARIQMRDQIADRLDTIGAASQRLTSDNQRQLAATLARSRELLSRLDGALYSNFLAKEKVTEIIARINWLHDDFNNELTSLSQDISWQQGSLIDQLTQKNSQDKNRQLQTTLRNVQDELQLVYALAHIETQVVDDLREQLANPNIDNLNNHISYLRYLKQTAESNMQSLARHPSTITLRQTIDELLNLGIAEQKMPAIMQERAEALTLLEQTLSAKEQTLSRFRSQIENQLGSSHQQLQTFNQRLGDIMSISGLLIIVATLLALLFAFILNHFYIRSRLIKRFTLLNQSVARLGCGELNTTIPVYGGDELGRIAELLRRTISQINQQKNQLKQEIDERRSIENDLRTAQDELIQAAKLAVVGQTMTTLAHEVNQPLNAMSLYLFSSEKALKNGDHHQLETNLDKMRGLILRIVNIIKQLRQFSRRSDADQQRQPIDLNASLDAAWDLLALRHRPLHAQIRKPENLPLVYGDDIRIQQVLVNLLTNALEACTLKPPVIEITTEQQTNNFSLILSDNGQGWPLALADRLLKPFTTSKSVGLGIGLSISQSIMEQCGGELRIASTLNRHGMVILQFRSVNHANQ
ncbi:two-component system sensor histidine kinase PgtB [Yersinia ruckeri]|uniref:histidine kinase n=1 Tax=Yersinia ruckeri TaxID=29486 RepID=A0A0A8VEC5_YERRU|nr:ATP-binding protein [Yersinia ruckeri]CEK26688.1 Phosphoglycerate transport system sensor protein PgtB [Yersinia ruckeri]